MTKLVLFLFGPSWKSSLVGLGVGVATAIVTYAQAQPEPGWYLVAMGFAALGRLVKDSDKSNASTPIATSQKVG